MYKVTTVMKRRSGMSVEDFQGYWLNKHAPVAARLPGLQRYLQSHALPQGYRKMELPYDGISEMWFDSRAAWQQALESPPGQAMHEDLAHFTNSDALIVIPVETHVIVGGEVPQQAVKNIEFVTCRTGMGLKEFRAYWKDVHGPLASHITVIRRYEQDHTAMDEYSGNGKPALDGLAITWFESTAAMKQGATTPAYEETRADEPNFLPDGHLPFIVTTEHRIVG